MEIKLICFVCQYVSQTWQNLGEFTIFVEPGPYQGHMTHNPCPHCGNRQWILRVYLKAGKKDEPRT